MIIIKYIDLNNIIFLLISLFIMIIYYFINILIKKQFLIDFLYSPFFFSYIILDRENNYENQNFKNIYI